MEERLADPERELALSYAPRERRAILRALWALDERFGAIVAASSEPAIGEMRLLWWREELEKLGQGAPAEPLLARIETALDNAAALAAQWGALAEGWHALLQAPIGDTELRRFAVRRGGRLFTLSAAVLGAESSARIECAGRSWALADLGHRSSDAALAEAARAAARDTVEPFERQSWPHLLRPLGALAALARRDAYSSSRRQGSPMRVARMAWHRLTGR